MTKPRLLDLFCGAGGAGAGYERAGFEVVGIDIADQPRYPFEFYKADAVRVADQLQPVGNGSWSVWGWPRLGYFDAVHASPPCQGYSAMSACRPGLAEGYPRLIEPIRDAFQKAVVPYVIENVVGAPLIDPVMLCGRMFGYELYRHRLFETNWTLKQPKHHTSMHLMPASKAGHWEPGTVMSVAGHFSPMEHARRVMAIDWMTRDEMAEAIPPYFTGYVGNALMAHLRSVREDVA